MAGFVEWYIASRNPLDNLISTRVLLTCVAHSTRALPASSSTSLLTRGVVFHACRWPSTARHLPVAGGEQPLAQGAAVRGPLARVGRRLQPRAQRGAPCVGLNDTMLTCCTFLSTQTRRVAHAGREALAIVYRGWRSDSIAPQLLRRVAALPSRRRRRVQTSRASTCSPWARRQRCSVRSHSKGGSRS